MTSHEEIRAGLAREREVRKSAYIKAVGEQDALPADADRFTLRRAEARVELARTAMRQWGDPEPEASNGSAAREGLSPSSVVRPADAAETAETVAERILASDTVPGEGRKDAEVEAIAARIAAARSA